MPPSLIDIDQHFAATVLNEVLDKLCQRFMWSRDEAYGFLLGSSLAWRVHRGKTDAQIIEEVQATLAQARPAPPRGDGG